ncbi:MULTISPECIES: DoxX family protein [unclassified Kitasatospora]|uniref:DoxX family protein n=1 Tax=unclassified Kitasatospora TaxID=2633591 RepID=UPI001ADF697B|nr:DoxX family protein [Kitasatospora sp. RG8]MBP0453201.1 DoxX family protein [Kitasatospora sp. RG8]
MPTTVQQALDSARPVVLTAFRVVVGLLFACHGAASLFGVFGGAKGGGTIPVGQWPGWWAALIQLVGGALVLAGLGTRIAALLCSGSMAYAYFTVHQEHALLPLQNGGEASVMFCWAFLAIAVLGSGPFAVDRLFTGRAGVRAGRTGRAEHSGHGSQPTPAG